MNQNYQKSFREKKVPSLIRPNLQSFWLTPLDEKVIVITSWIFLSTEGVGISPTVVIPTDIRQMSDGLRSLTLLNVYASHAQMPTANKRQQQLTVINYNTVFNMRI